MTTTDGPSTLPRLERRFAPDGTERINLSGVWNLQVLEGRLTGISQELAGCAADPPLHWDLRDIDALDDAGAWLLWRAWGRCLPERVSLLPEQQAHFSQLASTPRASSGRSHWDPAVPVARLGAAVLSLAEQTLGIVGLLGQILIDLICLLRQPGSIPWREVSANIYRTGARALPGTALLGFLVGMVLSYLSSRQLKTFGADIFIVDILGIGILRELGPMLAAVLVAGRSGSSMTAQLGVMRVTQELDALAVMGISRTLRLILPKIVALALALPLLALWTDAIALAGGMVAAGWELGLDYRQFLARLPDAVPLANLWLGITKGAIFGSLIALIACHYGLRVKPNTESLGAGTTNSVVTAITAVIIVDAIVAVLFPDLGIRL